MDTLANAISLLARSSFWGSSAGTDIDCEGALGGCRVGRGGGGSEGAVGAEGCLTGVASALAKVTRAAAGASDLKSFSASEEFISDSSLSSRYVLLTAALCEARAG